MLSRQACSVAPALNHVPSGFYRGKATPTLPADALRTMLEMLC